MIRVRTIAALALVALSACSNDPGVPQAVAVAVTAPEEAADKEVLIATQPSQAKVLLQGAEVGATPMKLLIRGDTNVVLEKEGYIRQALMLTQKSDPNVVVTLVPSGDVAAPAEPAPEPDAQKPASGRPAPKKGAEGSAAAPAEPAASAGTAAPAEPAAATTTAPAEAATAPATPSPKKTEYVNMRQIKEALRAGAITRDEYSRWQGIIRQNREAEYEATKKDLRERRITEQQYEEKIRAIRAKYEG